MCILKWFFCLKSKHADFIGKLWRKITKSILMYSVTLAINGKLLWRRYWKIKLEAIQKIMFCNFTQNLLVKNFRFVNLIIAATIFFFIVSSSLVKSQWRWNCFVTAWYKNHILRINFLDLKKKINHIIDIITKCKYLSGKAIESTNVCANDYGKKMEMKIKEKKIKFQQQLLPKSEL